MKEGVLSYVRMECFCLVGMPGFLSIFLFVCLCFRSCHSYESVFPLDLSLLPQVQHLGDSSIMREEGLRYVYRLHMA